MRTMLLNFGVPLGTRALNTLRRWHIVLLQKIKFHSDSNEYFNVQSKYLKRENKEGNEEVSAGLLLSLNHLEPFFSVIEKRPCLLKSYII